METPASTRRVTRSQTRAAAAAAKNNSLFSRKIEESKKSRTKSRQGDRLALVDITNDSPIAGLATRSLKTPSSRAMSKKKLIGGRGHTPGSGEALLRAQVEALLQKVEEEKFNSPINLGADFCTDGDASSSPYLTPSIIFPQMTISERIDQEKGKEGRIEFEDRITRSLLLDFSEKSSDSPSSSSDAAEICSVQVKASRTIEEEEEEEDVDDEVALDELCEGIRKISVHPSVVGGGVLRLKGLPTPKGKHIRFLRRYKN